MPVANPIQTQNLSVDPILFTDVAAPSGYDRVRVISPLTASIFVRGGAGQAEIEIGAGGAADFGEPITRDESAYRRQFGAGNASQVRVARFSTGDVICQVRSSAGAGPVKLVWS